MAGEMKSAKERSVKKKDGDTHTSDTLAHTGGMGPRDT